MRSTPKRQILVLGLGNDQGDETAGLAAARELRPNFEQRVDIVEARGNRLLDLLEGYDSALILDSVKAGGEPGSVLEFSSEGAPRVLAPAPHCAALAGVLKAAEKLGASFPKRISILVLVVGPSMEAVLPFFVTRAKQILEAWQDLDHCAEIAASGP